MLFQLRLAGLNPAEKASVIECRHLPGLGLLRQEIVPGQAGKILGRQGDVSRQGDVPFVPPDLAN